MRCGVGSTFDVQPITSPCRQPPRCTGSRVSCAYPAIRVIAGAPAYNQCRPALWGMVGHALLSAGEDSSPCQTPQGETRIPLLAKTHRLVEWAPSVLCRRWAGLGGGLGVMPISPGSAWERGKISPAPIPPKSGASVLNGALPEVGQGRIPPLSSHSSRPLLKPEPLEVNMQEGGTIVSESDCHRQ